MEAIQLCDFVHFVMLKITSKPILAVTCLAHVIVYMNMCACKYSLWPETCIKLCIFYVPNTIPQTRTDTMLGREHAGKLSSLKCVYRKLWLLGASCC